MIEFLVSFVFSVGFLFLFISLGINFTSGYIAHYATYMASRAYLTGGKDASVNASTIDSQAKTEAEEVFKGFHVEAFNVTTEIKFNPLPNSGGDKYEYTGAKIEFQRDLSMIGFGGGGLKLDLVSESFLGREPSRADCHDQLCQVYGVCGENTATEVHITLEDNGC